MDYFNDKPQLIEPGITYFLNESLKKSHIIKEKYHNYVFNFGMLLLFIIILAFILLYKYKGKLTPLQKKQKEKEKQEYILTKIKNFEIAKKKAHQELITGLPGWDSDISALNTKLVY